jgi:NAD(P)-dependent dehydrogenase (short-subunit alcohol dehydrogenase family)
VTDGGSETTPEAWHRTCAVNVLSHFLVTRAALEVLSEGGSIVYVGSVADLRPGSQVPAYDASKAALIGLCRQVALEGGRARHPRQRGGAWPDRHAAGAPGLRGPPLP